MSADGIDVVLTCARHELDDLYQRASADLDSARNTESELDDLAERLAALQTDRPSSTSTESVDRQPVRQDLGGSASRTWEELRAEAETGLRSRGIDPAHVDIDALIDPAEAARIERRATGGYDLHARLDRYDVLFAVAAGVAATVVDGLVVGIPRDIRWNGEWQEGSWVTGWLRDQAIPSDNWLAKIAKVPFDLMMVDGVPVPGLSGPNHRVQTFGHDPLFGLVLGTLDIMRGTITGASSGGVFVKQTPMVGVSNPLEALTLEIMHLLSDLPTRAGLPVPGWSMLTTITAGNYQGHSVDEWARLMYLRGYNSWHFMSMATVPATVHLVTRAYWGMRQTLVPEYAETVELERGPNGDAASGHPRFDSILLAAHAVAAAGNIGKLIAYGGNPLALNYNEWLAFIRAAFARLSEPRPSVSERIATRSYANSAALADGWVDLAALSDLPALPYEAG